MATINISIRIVLIGFTAIIMSFIPEVIPTYFGDWLCVGSIHYNGAKLVNECMHQSMPHNPQWHWGYRHFVWFFMGLSLAFTQIYYIIKNIK